MYSKGLCLLIIEPFYMYCLNNNCNICDHDIIFTNNYVHMEQVSYILLVLCIIYIRQVHRMAVCRVQI